ncbi:hypothetical protein BH10BAC6_BH10BAC6_09080 [soil metagenome]
MRSLILTSAMVLAASMPALAQNIIVAGVDKLAPQFTRVAQSCGMWQYTATERRNIPDPPTNPPAATDQVDRGLKGIALSADPRNKNVKLTLITDSFFPKDNAYKSFVFDVSLVDPSKDGYAVVIITDWADNISFDTLTIPATSPALSTTSVNHGLVRIDRTDRKTVTLSNTTGQPLSVTSIALAGGSSYQVVSGGSPPAFVLPVGGSRDVVVEFKPTTVATGAVNDQLVITTACSSSSIALSGTVGVPRISVDDWNVGNVEQGMEVCKEEGLRVMNNGNFDVVVSKFTFSDPSFTLTDPTDPALPITIAGGAQVMVKRACYKSSTTGAHVVDVTLSSDAYEGDSVSRWTATGTTTDVNDVDVATSFAVRYDRASDAFAFRNALADDDITIFDTRGIVVSQSNGSVNRIDARSLSSGIYLVTRRSHGTTTTETLAISR